MRISYLTAALVMLMPAMAHATNAPNLQEQQAREQARAAAVAASKAFGQDKTVILEEPARSYFDWGAIIQPSGKVVSVRSTSVAQTMGVQQGDVLTHINQQPIDSRELANTLAQFERLQHDEAFTVTVQRDGGAVTLNGIARAAVIPGWKLEVTSDIADRAVVTDNNQACGRVSVFLTPPSTSDLYPAFINSINGENVRQQNPNFILGVGEHQLGIHELIDNNSSRRGGRLELEKTLTLHIEENKKYHVAAHFIREKRFERHGEGYWEPVVWKVTEQTCTLN